MDFKCHCGRRLQPDPNTPQGEAQDGRILQAGHCPVHGWVGSDGASPVVPVTPVEDPYGSLG